MAFYFTSETLGRGEFETPSKIKFSGFMISILKSYDPINLSQDFFLITSSIVFTLSVSGPVLR